ncbi:MAG: site-specific DNA-methyltransferase [Actinobacteria bacterium]|nr:site-specific DNA-methyltransferase [Actinomycetota bacterium]
MIKPYYEEKNITIYCGDCLEVMKNIEPVDMILTSPPYDDLRSYQGFKFDFKNIANEIFKVLKNDGILIWVTGDQTVDGSETATSFKQAIYFKDLGFKLHDTMIYLKDPRYPDSVRYSQAFEYMFVFTKTGPKTFNPIQKKNNSSYLVKGCYNRNKNGTITKVYRPSRGEANMVNYWYYSAGYMKSAKDKYIFEHPAIFPESLAMDHIISWTNENDIVLDPFLGSGATARACKDLGRKCIGIEISKEYCDIAVKRLAQEVLF